MSIAQFITARIYAKKMIEFLRMRQEIKRIERERLEKVKARALRSSQYRRTFTMAPGAKGKNAASTNSKPDLSSNNPERALADNALLNASKRDVNGSIHSQSAKDVGNNVIEEEEQEHMEEQSDGEKDKGKLEHAKNFAKQGRLQLIANRQDAKDIDAPNRMNKDAG